MTTISKSQFLYLLVFIVLLCIATIIHRENLLLKNDINNENKLLHSLITQIGEIQNETPPFGYLQHNNNNNNDDDDGDDYENNNNDMEKEGMKIWNEIENIESQLNNEFDRFHIFLQNSLLRCHPQNNIFDYFDVGGDDDQLLSIFEVNTAIKSFFNSQFGFNATNINIINESDDNYRNYNLIQNHNNMLNQNNAEIIQKMLENDVHFIEFLQQYIPKTFTKLFECKTEEMNNPYRDKNIPHSPTFSLNSGAKNWFDFASDEEMQKMMNDLERKKEEKIARFKNLKKEGDDNVLVIITGDEYPYSSWLSRVAVNSLKRVQQKNVLRIVNIQTEHNRYYLYDPIIEKDRHDRHSRDENIIIDNDDDDGKHEINNENHFFNFTHFSPKTKWEHVGLNDSLIFICKSYFVAPDFYAPNNRIGGLIEFFRYIDESKTKRFENITTFIILDQDMIILKKLSFETDRSHAFAHFSGILRISSEMVKKYVNPFAIPFIDVPDVAVPYIIHVDDMRLMVNDWLKITLELREETNEAVIAKKDWTAEMYGFTLAASRFNIQFYHFPSNFVILPPYSEIQQADDPYFVHYAYDIKYPELNYGFHKRDYLGGHPIPVPFPTPPPGVSNSVSLFIQHLNENLLALYGPTFPSLFYNNNSKNDSSR